jgi:opacity protein-like surface antigen
MRRSAVVLATAALVFTAVTASAQGKKWDVNLGGGYTFVLGDARGHLNDGFNLAAGFTYRVTNWLGFQAEWGYIRPAQQTIQKPVSGTPGGASVPTDFFIGSSAQYGDLNLVLGRKTSGTFSPYVVGGIGVYYRSVAIKTNGLGFVPGGCDPYWLYCMPGGFVDVVNVVAGRSTWDMGMDVGGGVKIALGESSTLYLEARYHYIWGPTIRPDAAAVAAGAPAAVTVNGQFFPIVVGFRF